MGFAELTPEALLAAGFGAPEVAERSWRVRWDTVADPAALALARLPAAIDFQTSGSTGPSQTWRRERESVWLEAGMLAELLAPERPQVLVSFVPPVHVYGALASVLVPAHLRVPAWFRPGFIGAMPPIEQRRAVVVATPWIFTLLRENLPWVRRLEHLTVLHGGAMLPASAGEFLGEAGSDRALIVEVLGSTEAGGIATRRWRYGEPPPWTLFRDVSFAMPAPAGRSREAGEAMETGTAGPEVPLVVRSPRLASRPGEPPPATWEADDHVQPLDARRFRFAGRRTRLVKVNGRRINLDEAEHALRGLLDCADFAVVPVADAMIGEHLDLLVVLRPGTALSDLDLAAGFTVLGVRPRRVRVVPRIDRSETGKLRHVQPALTT